MPYVYTNQQPRLIFQPTAVQPLFPAVPSFRQLLLREVVLEFVKASIPEIIKELLTPPRRRCSRSMLRLG